MVEGGGGPSFPVVFFDGEREMNIGHVSINPTLEYKPFQLMLSQMIGISPNQISIYLLDRRKTPKSPFSDDRRRIPITGKVNFASICRQKDCCFLVVLKRSRKSRSRRERNTNGLEFADFLPENAILLRRDQPVPFYDQITQSELADLNERLQSLRMHRENYEMAMAMENPTTTIRFREPDPDPVMDLDSFPTTTMMMMMTKNGTGKALCCEECSKRNTASFHACVNDAVVVRFKTRWGPIGRPRPNRPRY